MLLYGTNCVRSASSYQTVAELSEARSQFFFWQHLESADHPLRVAMRRNVMVYVFVFVSALCLHQAAALEDACMVKWFSLSGINSASAIDYTSSMKRVEIDEVSINTYTPTGLLPLFQVLLIHNENDSRLFLSCINGNNQTCIDSAPCQNDGKCVLDKAQGAYRCNCTAGWTGHSCKKRSANEALHNNQDNILEALQDMKLLMQSIQEQQARLQKFTVNEIKASEDRLKERIDCSRAPRPTTMLPEANPCAENPCLNGANCEKSGVDGYSCVCAEGFRGTNCQTAASPCESAPCMNGAICFSESPGTFSCFCGTGYTGSTCSQEVDPCAENPCLNGANCVKSGVDGYSCICAEGYKGTNCQTATSPCDSAPCMNGAICVSEGPNSFSCICDEGYTGLTCSQAVVTVDREAATSARFSVPTRLAQRGRWRVVVSSGSEATTVSAVQGQQASVVEGLSPNTVYTAQIFGANGESSTLAPFLTRPFMGEATGSFTGKVNAGWRVRPDGRVAFALSSTNDQGYLGLGISNDGLMPNSDIITMFNGISGPQIQDRKAFGRTRPIVDGDSQVGDISFSRFNGITTYAFSLPCNSPDEDDIPLQGSHYLLFASGSLRNNNPAYHRYRAITPNQVTINCEGSTPPAPTTVAPTVQSVWAIVSGGVTGSSVDLQLPRSTGAAVTWTIETRSGRTLVSSVTASSSSQRTTVTGLQPNTVYTVSATGSGGETTEPIIFATRPIDGQPTGSYNGVLDAVWKVNAAGGVDFALSTSDDSGWLGLGISNDAAMPVSDIITMYRDAGGAVQVQDRRAFGRTRPPVDDDNQVSDIAYSRFNGVTTYAFTLPCSSSDANDIPLHGTHHVLLAKGPLRNGDISYHSARQVVPNRVTIACGTVCDSAPCLNGGSCSESGSSFSCVCTAAYEGDTCQTVVEVSASTASVSDSSATVRLSHPFPDSDPWMVTLSSGGNIISTISVPGGAVEVRLNGLEPNQVYEAIVTRPGGLVLSTLPFLTRPFAGSAAGSTSNRILTAEWRPSADRVHFALSIPTTRNYVGFGISNDRFMPNSDIMTMFMDGSGVPQVQDRYVTERVRPGVDADNQVRDLRVSQFNGMITYSFSLPCSSQDSRDIPIQGSHYLLFARGAVLNGDITYHSQSLATQTPVTIMCSPLLEV